VIKKNLLPMMMGLAMIGGDTIEPKSQKVHDDLEALAEAGRKESRLVRFCETIL